MANSDLLVAAVRWLAREERGTTVRTRIPVPPMILLMGAQSHWLFIFIVVLVVFILVVVLVILLSRVRKTRTTTRTRTIWLRPTAALWCDPLRCDPLRCDPLRCDPNGRHRREEYGMQDRRAAAAVSALLKI